MTILNEENWKIDNLLKSVFKWSEKRKGFLYFGSFYGLGITSDMKKEKQLEIIQDYIDKEGFYFDEDSDWSINDKYKQKVCLQIIK